MSQGPVNPVMWQFPAKPVVAAVGPGNNTDPSGVSLGLTAAVSARNDSNGAWATLAGIDPLFARPTGVVGKSTNLGVYGETTGNAPEGNSVGVTGNGGPNGIGVLEAVS